jgi:mannose-6-phosphate isomerase-like protein (cupin superfamily)
MPVVSNEQAREIPWRPGYRNFVLAGAEHGISTSCSMGLIEPGAGAPLHLHHEVDEVIVVLEGTLDFQLGDEHFIVGPNHTISIPARTPHAFTVVGAERARIVGYMPKQGAYVAAEYIGGAPPLGAQLK